EHAPGERVVDDLDADERGIVLRAARLAPRERLAAHRTIPLDHPELQYHNATQGWVDQGRSSVTRNASSTDWRSACASRSIRPRRRALSTERSWSPRARAGLPLTVTAASPG